MILGNYNPLGCGFDPMLIAQNCELHPTGICLARNSGMFPGITGSLASFMSFLNLSSVVFAENARRFLSVKTRFRIYQTMTRDPSNQKSSESREHFYLCATLRINLAPGCVTQRRGRWVVQRDAIFLEALKELVWCVGASWGNGTIATDGVGSSGEGTQPTQSVGTKSMSLTKGPSIN